MPNTIKSLIEDLTGQPAPFDIDVEEPALTLLKDSGIGYSQLNELLLWLGYDRVTDWFFQYLLDRKLDYRPESVFKSMDQLRAGVDSFRQFAMLRFGNVKFAFKRLSTLPRVDLADELSLLEPADLTKFESRHDPLLPVEAIPSEDTYYLGYIIERSLKERLQRNPNDVEAKQELEKREQIVEKGKRNQTAYLLSDHMDVYVATSMRERHEFQMIGDVVKEVFGNPKLKPLKLRWFDPTQAYCFDRIDKGLSEALMLKRAICTLYLAQESDTLGKDSELASTLAQGKPVIAYVPRVLEQNQETHVERLLEVVQRGSPGQSVQEVILSQLRIFHPNGAWSDNEVMSWLANPQGMDLAVAKHKLGEHIRGHYDTRAKTLKESHPLGIQVNLESGLSNGVLVARTCDECADLVYRIMTRTLEFDTKIQQLVGSEKCLLLVERTTQSIFRVVTGDRLLTNTFWNFYLS